MYWYYGDHTTWEMVMEKILCDKRRTEVHLHVTDSQLSNIMNLTIQSNFTSFYNGVACVKIEVIGVNVSQYADYS